MPRWVAVAMIGALATATASAQDIDAMAAAVDADVIDWRRDFHAHPELGNRETRTAGKVAAHLKSLGLEVQTGVAHTGVVGILRGGKPGPKVALRADMDGLPVTEATGLPFESKATATYKGAEVGVMHACGHDAHTAVLMGVAEALAGIREQLTGDVMFIFQPAEEGSPEGERGGAELMLEEGLFKAFKPDAVFGLHVFSTMNVGEIGYRSGPLLAAVDTFRLTVSGRQTHGARPWGGIDPVVAMAAIITDAQHLIARRVDLTDSPGIVTFGTINGGVRHNIIPDEVVATGTLRSFTPKARTAIHEGLRAVTEHIAVAHGATAKLELPYGESYPVTFNDPALTAATLPALAGVVGADHLHEIPLVTGAEDFSFLAKEVPGFYFIVGATKRGVDPSTAPSNHSPQFTVDEEALRIATRTMLAATLNRLGAPAGEQDNH